MSDGTAEAVVEQVPAGTSPTPWSAVKWWQGLLLIAGSLVSAAAVSASLGAEQSANRFLTDWTGNSIGYAVVIPLLSLTGWLAAQNRVKREVRRWALLPGLVLALSELLGKSLNAYSSAGVWLDSGGMALKGLVVFAGYFWLGYTVAVVVIAYVVQPAQVRLSLVQPLAGRAAKARAWVVALAGRHPRRLFLIAWALLVVSRIPYLIWLWPGCLTPDGLDQINQAIGLAPLSNHHPVIQTLVLKVFVGPADTLGDITWGVAAYSIVQILATSAAMAYATTRLLRWRVPFWAVVVGFAWFAIFPVNAVYAITVWKNIPFAAAMLMVIVMLVDLARDGTVARRVGWLAGLASCLLAVFLFRSDGPVAAFAAGVALVVLVRRGARLRALAALVLAFALGSTIVGPVYQAIGAKPSSIREALSVPLQQVARVSRDHPDHLDSDQVRFVQNLFGGLAPTDVGALYNPELSDPVKAAADDKFIKEHLAEFIGGWMSLGIRYPRDYINSFLANSYGYWYPEYSNWVVYAGINGRPPVPGLSPSPPSRQPDVVLTALFAPRMMPGLSMVYSIGFGLQLFVLAFAALGATRRLRLAWCLLPLAAVWLVCLASPVAGEYRYAYGYLIALPVILGVTLQHPARGGVMLRPAT